MAFGTTEWIIIGALILLLFGATAIPKLARGLGKAQGEFQKARGEFQEELERGRAESGERRPEEDETPTEEEPRT